MYAESRYIRSLINQREKEKVAKILLVVTILYFIENENSTNILKIY